MIRKMKSESKTTTQSTTKPTTKSIIKVTTSKTVVQSSKPSSGSSSCTCQPKMVKRTDVCMDGSNKWKDEKTRAKYLRVATMSDAVSTKSTWCKKGLIGQWQISGGDGIKIGGWGYKCDTQNYGQPLTSDQACPKFFTFLICLACPIEG